MLVNANSQSIPLAPRSVQCVVTSPPYWGLRDYGVKNQLGLEQTPQEYVTNMVAVFAEVWRVLRDDGTLWLNLGDSYNSAGRKGQGTREGYKQKTNRASAEGVDQNRPTDSNLKEKDMIGIPWRVAFALQDFGWYLRSDIIWNKPNPMPESVTDRPTKSHEYLFLLTKSPKYFYDLDAIREPVKEVTIRRLSQPNFENQGGGSKDPINGGKGSVNRSERRTLENLKERYSKEGVWSDRQAGYEAWKEMNIGRNRRTVWEIATQPTSEAHFATFPEKLVEPCILAGTSARGACPVCGKPWIRKTIKKKNKISDSLRYSGNRDRNDSEDGRFESETITLDWIPDCKHKTESPVPCIVLDPFSGSGTSG